MSVWNFGKQILFRCALFVLCAAPLQALSFFGISRDGNVGDRNQLLGVLSALRQTSSKEIHDSWFSSQDPEAIQRALDKLSPGEQVWVVGAGEGGVEGIRPLQDAPSRVKFCLTSHTFLPAYLEEELRNKVSLFAVATHAVPPDLPPELSEKLVRTVVVSHNRQPEEVDEVCEAYKELVPLADRYMVVVLGGDVREPLTDGTFRLRRFDEEEARKLSAFVASSLEPETAVLCLDGPRTGKFGPDGEEDGNAHRAGNTSAVTDAFVSALLEKIPAERFKLLPFQHGTREENPHILPCNGFALAMGALRAHGGEILVGGDSTSMCSEVVDLLRALRKKVRVIFYTHAAMDDSNRAFVESALQAGDVSVLINYEELRTPPAKSSEGDGQAPDKARGAAQTIAQALWNLFPEAP